MSSLFCLRCRYQPVRGFSLIEMMVVLSIFVIMMAVVLANLPSFREKTTLDLIAQEIAITIRQAQVYGLGTRSFGVNVFPSFGIYFNQGVLGTRSFVLYADSDGGGSYDPDTGCGEAVTECVEEFLILGGVAIKTAEGLVVCNDNNCGTPTIITETEDLAINFTRPYPEAEFVVDGSVNPGSYAKIIIESTRNPSQQREIQVWSTGQISVKTI